MNKKEKVIEEIILLGPWFHNIEVMEGVFTREIDPSPGPQSVDHPMPRWNALKPHLTKSMDGLDVLDVGSADGYFRLNLSKWGLTYWRQIHGKPG